MGADVRSAVDVEKSSIGIDSWCVVDEPSRTAAVTSSRGVPIRWASFGGAFVPCAESWPSSHPYGSIP